MESLIFEEEKTIKDIRNLFRLEKETKGIADRILRYIKKLFEHEEEENYYKPVITFYFTLFSAFCFFIFTNVIC